MSLNQRFFLAIMLIVIAGLYIVPWHNYNINLPLLNHPYTLGLDLQGGVELDYLVDLSAVKSNSGVTNGTLGYNASTIVEGLKNIIDKRVNSLGLAEPNIQTVSYGSETHIIVQIPTQSYPDLSPADQEIKRAEDIQNAKDTIGKVVQLEFKEMKTNYTDEDYAERKALAEDIRKDLEDHIPWATVRDKYTLQYERITANTGSGELPLQAAFSGANEVKDFPYISPVFETETDPTYTVDASGQPVITTSTGYTVTVLTNRTGSGEYDYSYLSVDASPSVWTPAKTADGRVLNDQYLVSAGVSFNANTNEPQVSLAFNDEGRKIFSELTSRLVGKQIAIFIGGELLTAPVVTTVITDGNAVITGQSSIADAQKLANDINTGIVPAPIYLTSERTIDAKVGASALEQILIAGIIGLGVIIIFLSIFYKTGGLLAGIALVSYTLFLIAIIKLTGVVLTIASIAGVILSIGLAIDANILIFERTREVLREGGSLSKAISLGFDHSWTAIWDSHITSFFSALILYIFGVSMIKGFGLMLGIGILLSLFTAMWVSRVLIQYAAKYIQNPFILFGFKKKK